MDKFLQQKALELGAYKAGIVDVKDIVLDKIFRKMCESNACGNYGKNYTCPPDVGDIEELMSKVKSYSKAVVYQTVGELEDSYDFEGMMEAGAQHTALVQKMWDVTDEMNYKNLLHLGAGGCHLCPVCGKISGTPCAHPKRAMSSLEAHGINVSKLAEQAGMKYINGQNTVTYFGVILLGE